MKVALISNTFSVEAGTGIAKYSNELLSGLVRRGFDVDPIDPASMTQKGQKFFNYSPMFAFHVLKRTRNVDIVHALSPAWAFAFPFIKKPKVVTYHDTMSISCKRCRLSQYSHLVNPLIYAIAGSLSKRVIAVSSQTKADLISVTGLPNEKIAVISHGVDDRFKVIERCKKDGYVIGYIGALLRNKRVDFLIKAFSCFKRRYPGMDVSLHIYGGRPVEYQRLLSLTRALNVEKCVLFKGFCPEDALVGAYNSFDVFVLPSEWEGFGIPILEAQKCGVPVIIRGEAHIPGETSLHCVKSSSCSDMADKMYALLSDPVLRDRTIGAGLDYSKGFSWESMVEKTIELYEDII